VVTQVRISGNLEKCIEVLVEKPKRNNHLQDPELNMGKN
jgi:hypothetical protein